MCTADLRDIGLVWALYLMKPDGSNQTKAFDLGPELPDWLDQSISWAR